MAFVQFSKVSLAFGDRDILKNVSVNLSAGSKAALTGANGSGKSTLMKVMAGLMECDSGDRAVQKNCRIGYLPQSGIVHHGCTLIEEADQAFSYLSEQEKTFPSLRRATPEDSDRTFVKDPEKLLKKKDRKTSQGEE